MKMSIQGAGRLVGVFASVSAFLLMIGCGSLGTEKMPPGNPSAGTSQPNAASTDRIRIGDPITIDFSGASDVPQRIVERLKEDGMIHLPLLKVPIKAVGKTRGELEDEIQKAYVPSIYQRLTVKVGVEGRFFVVSGEVRKPDRHPFLGDMTILQAIATAGDFTDFAKRAKVEISRGNAKPIVVDCNAAARDPQKNIQIFPDDIIKVPRRLF